MPKKLESENFRRVSFTLRLPLWLRKKLKKEESSSGKYIEELILEDKEWTAPKK